MIKQKKHRRSEQRREKTHFFDENLRLEAAVQAHRRCPLRRRRCRRRRHRCRRRRCRSFSQKALTSEKGIFGRMFLGLTLHLVVLSSFPVRGCD